jgi:hypothetical protein
MAWPQGAKTDPFGKSGNKLSTSLTRCKYIVGINSQVLEKVLVLFCCLRRMAEYNAGVCLSHDRSICEQESDYEQACGFY